MRAYRLCRTTYPAYDGEGARRVGGRWNSKGGRVVYMSENRSLAILEIPVHLSDTLPDKYLLGSADIPDEIVLDVVTDRALPDNWSTLIIGAPRMRINLSVFESSLRTQGRRPAPPAAHLLRPSR